MRRPLTSITVSAPNPSDTPARSGALTAVIPRTIAGLLYPTIDLRPAISRIARLRARAVRRGDALAPPRTPHRARADRRLARRPRRAHPRLPQRHRRARRRAGPDQRPDPAAGPPRRPVARLHLLRHAVRPA